MYIKCWGSRGSIPVSGKEYIKYGGDTTCIEIRTKDDDIIILDAGTGIRRLGKLLVEEKRFKYHLILTHFHWDHLMGFPFFKPLYMGKTHIIVHKCPVHGHFVENMLGRVMSPPNFPVKYSEIKAKISYKQACPELFEIGSVQITSIPLSHPNGGRGYKFVENNKSFVFLTDNELGFSHPQGVGYKQYVHFAKDADLLFHDAEYTSDEYSSYIQWGHSQYNDALSLAIDAKAKQLGLFHINAERTDKALDRIVQVCREDIEKQKSNIECFAVGSDMVFTV